MSNFATHVLGRTPPGAPAVASTRTPLLNSAQIAELEKLIGPACREFQSLLRENDPELFHEGLLHLAARFEGRSNHGPAAALYQTALQGPNEEIRAKAERRLAALSGGGSFGQRAEINLRQFAEQVTEPSAILGMGAGSLAFRLGRLGALGRLAGKNPLLGTRTWAGLAGFAAEVPAFTLVTKGSRALLGHAEDFSASQLGRELAGGAFFVGSLKAFGALSANPAGRFSQKFLPPFSQLTAIMAGHRLQQAFGLRPAMSSENFMLDAMVTWLHLQAGGRLAQSVLGRNWAGLERRLDLQASKLQRAPAWLAVPRWATQPMMMASTTPEQLGLLLPSFPAPSFRPSNIVPALAVPETQPNGKALLPEYNAEKQLSLELKPSPPPSPLRRRVEDLVKAEHRSTAASLLRKMQTLYREEAARTEVSFDLWLGRALRRANEHELEAAKPLLFTGPAEAVGARWLSWIEANRLGGGIPLLGKAAREDSRNSLHAVEALSRMAVEHRAAALEELARTVERADALTSRHALQAAIALKAEELLPRLRQLGQGKPSFLALGAQYARAELGDREMIPSLEAEFRAAGPAERIGLLEKLLALGAEGYDAQPLRRATLHANPKIRLDAALALVRLKESNSISSIKELIRGWGGRDIAQLAETLLNNGYPAQSEFLVRRLLQLQDPQALESAFGLAVEGRMVALIPALRSTQKSIYMSIRRSAWRSIAKLAGQSGDSKTLLEILKYREEARSRETEEQQRERETAEESVRLEAALALSNLKLGPRQALGVRSQLDALLQSPTPAIRLKSAFVLAARWDDLTAFRAVRSELKNSDPEISYSAARAMDKLQPGWDLGIRRFAQASRLALEELGIRYEAQPGNSAR